MHFHSPFLYQVCRLIVIPTILFCSTPSCKTTSKLSLNDAKEIGITNGQDFTAPPRSGITDGLINPNYLSKNDGNSCRDEPPEQVEIREVIKQSRNACRDTGATPGAEYCLGMSLFSKGQIALSLGQYSEAIILLKAAIANAGMVADEIYRPLLAYSYAAMRDFNKARWYTDAGQYTGLMKTRHRMYQAYANNYTGRASIAKIRGDYQEAEKYYRKAQKVCQAGREESDKNDFYDAIETQFLADIAEVLLMQGRLVESELLLRQVMDRFNIHGRLKAMKILGQVFYQQGRYSDAEVVLKATIGAYRLNKFQCWLLDLNRSHQTLSRILLAQDRPDEALEQFETIKHNLRHTPRVFNLRFANDPDWAYALMAKGAYDQAETMLVNALKFARDQYGDEHYRTAEIRGLLAVTQYRQSKKAKAEKNFNSALPILITYKRELGAVANTNVAFHRRLERVAEAYMDYIAETQGNTDTAARITFPIADAIRGNTVQQAILASSTRIAARDPRLAELVRKEQDGIKKIAALRQVLLNAQSQVNGRAKKTVSLEKEIEKLNQARRVILSEIEKRFPTYAEFTRPRPKTLANIKVALKPKEALLAYYIGSNKAFVWSITGSGPSSFVALPFNPRVIENHVSAVRKSLQPQGVQLDQLPEFALDAAHQLYQALLEPVRTSWVKSDRLIIVPHGILGHLPFAILTSSGKMQKSDNKVPLTEYRNVPWLIRDHSITVLPSSGSLITLRSLPKSDPNRRAFAGFGDPVFNREQELIQSAPKTQPAVIVDMPLGKPNASRTIATRAIRITKAATLDAKQLTSATLEMLQPLPDTREEILAIAATLGADIEHDVYLGRAASETTLKHLDLSNRRVLVFATHGLVAGDLDGLRQPALAFSSPKVIGDLNNDGLLTMGEIMGLRLDADWVVLSACNTAAGQGSGSEAVSGLGQAFFYAGTRAILVSNWPVESVSARFLTTELFRQQQVDSTLPRAVALQKSMLQLLDEGVCYNSQTGKPIYSYAHPLFWAPFVMVGDGN